MRYGHTQFEQFERELHALMLAVERECVEAELARYGLDVGEYETFELSGLGLADSPAQGCLQVTEGVAEARVAALGA